MFRGQDNKQTRSSTLVRLRLLLQQYDSGSRAPHVALL